MADDAARAARLAARQSRDREQENDTGHEEEKNGEKNNISSPVKGFQKPKKNKIWETRHT